MAQLHPQLNKNTGRQLGYQAAIVICCLVPLGALILFNVTRERPWLYVAAIAAVAGTFIGTGCYKQAAQLQSGLAGEAQTARLLRALPRDYHIITNAEYRVNGKPLELDALVIGPPGIFIVEAKNYAGELNGDAKAPFWQQTRSGKGGAPFTKEVKNPLLQLERQQLLLGQLLAECGQKYPVKGYVLFVNDFITINIKDSRIRKNGEAFVNGLQKLTPKLEKQEITAITKALLAKV